MRCTRTLVEVFLLNQTLIKCFVEKEVAVCVGIEPTYSIIELTPLHLSNVVERKRFELLDAFHINGFQDHRFQPLSHLSIIQLKSLTLILISKTPSNTGEA